MEKQNNVLTDFSSPYLAVDSVEISSDRQSIKFRSGQRHLDIEFQGELTEVRDLIEGLRNPASTVWKSIRSGEGDLHQIVSKFADLGWLQDASVRGKERVSGKISEIRATVDDAGRWLQEGIDDTLKMHPGYNDKILGVVRQIHLDTSKLIDSVLKGNRLLDALDDLPVSEGSNIARKALMIYTRSWQRTSATSLVVFCKSLEQLSYVDVSSERPFPPKLTALDDSLQIRNQIWAACCLLLLALHHEEEKWIKFVPGNLEGDSGINTVIHAEATAELFLENFGESALLRNIMENKEPTRCGAQVFLHQYHITRRYLEGVISFLRTRMPESLRDVGFEYLVEEIGHDVHEKAACVGLGIDANQLATFAPLPFFAVYSDLLAYFAEVSPVSLLLSVIVAEGMPGQRKVIADSLAKAGIENDDMVAHTELDMELNHSYYPRKLMARVEWIDAEERKKALHHFLFVLELSQLGWTQLSKYAQVKELPIVPEAFRTSPTFFVK